MTDDMVTLAQKREQKQKADKENKRAKAEERRKKYVPLSAIVVANIIFLSLDIRAFQAIYIITASYLLSVLTVLVSGGLAMYWFDVLYPHSKRHNNETQKNISLIFTVLAIGLSGVLAFADYVVGTGNSFSSAWSVGLWAAIIVLTISQGVAVAWWWSIDNHIAAEAKIQEAHAEASDQADEMAILRTKLQGLRGVLTDLENLNKDFTTDAVREVAKVLGIALPTGEVKPQQQKPQQFQPRQAGAMAKDTELPELDDRPNSQAGKRNG